MPTRKLPRWAGPASAVAVLAFAMFFSNRTAPMPQGFGAPITTDDEYTTALNQAKALSQAQLATYEAGRPLNADDKAKLREAGNLLDRMFAYQPLRASILCVSGEIHHILGEDEVAEERYRQCVLGTERQATSEPQGAAQIRATGGEAAYQLSLLLLNRRDFQGALEQTNFALKMTPQSAAYHTARASALNELRRTAEAKQELQTALQLDPNNARASSLLRFISH